MDQIRILLADDHNILRDGMRLLLERQPGFVVVGEASRRPRDPGAGAEHHQPDVVVMDIAMPNMNGIEATRRIVEKHPRNRCRDPEHALRRKLRHPVAQGRRARVPAEGCR